MSMVTEPQNLPIGQGASVDDATPRPWRLDADYAGVILGPHGKEIASACAGVAGYTLDDANAALIVRAVNNFDKMLAALIGVSVIAQRNIEDICGAAQEGEKLTPIDTLDIARWSDVLAAIDSATKLGARLTDEPSQATEAR